MRKKVLYILHNHPSIRPGGAEGYGLELYEAMRGSEEVEPVILARGSSRVPTVRLNHPGTHVGALEGDPNQYLFYTDDFEYDWNFGTLRDKEAYTRHLRAFLQACQPDVVHFQHTLFLGYDLIREVRNTLPHAPILYTLHEYLPICRRDGQMLRTLNNELCTHASPRRCHECFPEISPQDFFMRQRFIQSHLALVDRFICPSRFIADRYTAWGIPSEKLIIEENGRVPVPRAEGTDRGGRPRNRFGFFGQFNPFKGLDIALGAMSTLAKERGRAGPAADAPHLWVHGANLELQPGGFQNQITALLDATRHDVTLVGRYGPDDLPRLMANIDWVVVPSIWWENAPMVIQEAFMHGRPVICSNIGGMAEKVTDGVNGLHFAVSDPRSLARVMQMAATTPGLWERLAHGIPPTRDMTSHVCALSELYSTLLQERAAATAP